MSSDGRPQSGNRMRRIGPRALVVGACLSVGVLGLPGEFPALSPPKAQAASDPRYINCLAGAFPGVIPDAFPNAGPITYKASCIAVTPDAERWPITSLDKVRITFHFDKVIYMYHYNYDRVIFANSAGGGRLAGEVTRTYGYTARNAKVTGASCDFGWLNGGQHLFPCNLTYVPDPSVIGRCLVGRAFHSIFDPACIAEPVNPANGSYGTQVTDAAFASSGFPLQFHRTYDSADQTVGMLGKVTCSPEIGPPHVRLTSAR